MSFVVKRNAFGDKRTMNNFPRTRPSTLRFEQRVDLRSANRKRKTFIAEKHHRESSNSYKEGTVQIGHQSSNIETKFQLENVFLKNFSHWTTMMKILDKPTAVKMTKTLPLNSTVLKVSSMSASGMSTKAEANVWDMPIQRTPRFKWTTVTGS